MERGRDKVNIRATTAIPSSYKSTEVKHLGPLLANGWGTIQGLDGDAVDVNNKKSQKLRNGASIICFWAKINVCFFRTIKARIKRQACHSRELV